VRALLAAMIIVSAIAAASALAATTPIPLQAPGGYRDYCDGLANRSLCPAGRARQRLWRKLTLPALPAGAPCPVSAAQRIPPVARPVLGPGPVLLAAGAYSSAGRTTAEMAFPPTAGPAVGTGWGVAKTPLLLPKPFAEPLVVRGRRLDGAPEPLGFSGGHGRPYIAMQFTPGSPTIRLGSWKSYGLLMWATSPGCYGIQVDGRIFSRTIVFRVAFLPTT
jgi:hypothetical protein